VYNEAMVFYLEEVVVGTGFVEGAADPSLGTLRVVVQRLNR
jgi:hypothetical protein